MQSFPRPPVFHPHQAQIMSQQQKDTSQDNAINDNMTHAGLNTHLIEGIHADMQKILSQVDANHKDIKNIVELFTTIGCTIAKRQ